MLYKYFVIINKSFQIGIFTEAIKAVYVYAYCVDNVCMCIFIYYI